MTAWERLGIPLQLAMDEEDWEKPFSKLSAKAHPDAGGERMEFEALCQARDVLKDPYQRLERWLDAKGKHVGHSSAVSPEVAVMFEKVADLKLCLSEWLSLGEKTSSQLGRALHQRKGLQLRKRLESCLEEVTRWEGGMENEFGELSKASEKGDYERALEVRGELGFLRKWRSQLRGFYGQLWEGLEF